jgi:hypothetical protein
MDDKKVNDGFDLLSREDLDNVTGGIPYEKPCLISFIDGRILCYSGDLCNIGSFDDGPGCRPGYNCEVGPVVPDQ